jgi:hypothetical protein
MAAHRLLVQAVSPLLPQLPITATARKLEQLVRLPFGAVSPDTRRISIVTVTELHANRIARLASAAA